MSKEPKSFRHSTAFGGIKDEFLFDGYLITK
jgi:hypothetical protein